MYRSGVCGWWDGWRGDDVPVASGEGGPVTDYKFDPKMLEAAQQEPYDFAAFCESEASKVNCHVVYPESNQLQIDLDSDEAYEQFNKRFCELYRRTVHPAYQLACNPVETPSKSGLPHRHITLTFANKTFTEWERIVMQQMLGSDPIREQMNALRCACGILRPSRLFEPIPMPISVPELGELNEDFLS